MFGLFTLVTLHACGATVREPDALEPTSSDAQTEGSVTEASVVDARATASEDARAEAASASDAASPRCPATALPSMLKPLIDSVVAVTKTRAGAGSGAFVVPSAIDRDAFASNALAALGGDEAAACRLPASYRVFTLVDGGKSIRVVAELDGAGSPAPALFWGTYARREGTSRALVLEAPHPVFDTNTADESQDIFLRADARWLLVAGAQRCANTTPSPCSGTTTACGPTAPYRESDTAHSVVTPFHALHRELSRGSSTLLFAQMHGNSASCPQALISTAGSGSVWPTTGFVRTFADALAPTGTTIGQCGAGYPTAGCDLCGGGNVQARETAGAADACTMAAPDSGRFLHLEQLLALRSRTANGVGWEPVLQALVAAVPP